MITRKALVQSLYMLWSIFPIASLFGKEIARNANEIERYRKRDHP